MSIEWVRVPGAVLGIPHIPSALPQRPYRGGGRGLCPPASQMRKGVWPLGLGLEPESDTEAPGLTCLPPFLYLII